jgi:hypothetical protein
MKPIGEGVMKSYTYDEKKRKERGSIYRLYLHLCD